MVERARDPKVWVWLAAACLVACSDPEGEPEPVGDVGAGADVGVGVDAAVDAGGDVGADARVEETQTCASLTALEVCAGGACEERPCRGDEVCQQDVCIPWTQGDLFADFTLTQSPDDPFEVAIEVSPGGFPRAHAEQIRFTFGDGVVGWGESLTHTYEAPGVYPVELAVRLDGHRMLYASRVAVVEPGEDHAPLHLTVNGIPDYMSGSVPVMLDSGTPADPSDDVEVAIRHQVARDRFTVDVLLTSDPADPIDEATLALTADVELGGVPAGGDLSGLLEFDEGERDRARRARVQMTPALAPPPGLVTWTLSARAVSGRMHVRTITVDAVELTPALDPFDAPLVWLFRTDVDFFTTTREELGASSYGLRSTAFPNGQPDFDEELRLMGALGSDEGLNARYLGWIRELLRKEVYRYYGIAPDGTPRDGIAFEIVWQGEPGAPDPADYSDTGTFSMMRFGGIFNGAIGFSKYSEHQIERSNNARIGRGVATSAILNGLTSINLLSPALGPINPRVGARVGDDPNDAVVLDPGFDPYADHPDEVLERYRDLETVATYIALAVAPITAHEMGHAMGLVPLGLPPQGFFGGRPDVTFVGDQLTNGRHADLPGVSLMQSGGGDQLALVQQLLDLIETEPRVRLIELAQILSKETRLSPLSRAYLQRKLTYLPAPEE
jgi:hypothetical protein